MKNPTYTNLGDLENFLKAKNIKNVFIISGLNSYVKSGAKKIMKKFLLNKKTKFFFKKSALPEINELKRIINSIKDFSPDLIIAIGGGSVIDYAKIANSLELSKNYIAIVVGGEWLYRTYNNWNKVIERLLINDATLNIVLLGSQNGLISSGKLTKEFSNFNVEEYVGKFTFNQTTEIIKRASILLCCDGGLMHAANAVNTPVIPLLARLDESMQLTESIKHYALFDKLDVNNIDFEKICKAYLEASKYFDNSSS